MNAADTPTSHSFIAYLHPSQKRLDNADAWQYWWCKTWHQASLASVYNLDSFKWLSEQVLIEVWCTLNLHLPSEQHIADISGPVLVLKSLPNQYILVTRSLMFRQEPKALKMQSDTSLAMDKPHLHIYVVSCMNKSCGPISSVKVFFTADEMLLGGNWSLESWLCPSSNELRGREWAKALHLDC